MDKDVVRDSLDKMGVPWDSSLRAEAMEFADRDMDEKLLWLFVDSRRQKHSKSFREHFTDWAATAALIAYGIFDNRDNLPPPMGGR